MQQQEEELEAQTKAIQDLKDKLASEHRHSSRHTSDRSGEHHSRRPTHEDSKVRDSDREQRHREDRSHRSESHRHRERDAHRSHSVTHRRERESSVTSSRHSSSKRRDERSRNEDRRHSQSRGDRILEDEERAPQSGTSSLRSPQEEVSGTIEADYPVAERHISINGAATKSSHASNGIAAIDAEGSKTAKARSQAIEEEAEDYEPEIDLGEDLLAEEEEEAPTVKSAPPVAPRARSRSRERHTALGSHRRSSQRTRSRSPVRQSEHWQDEERRPRHGHPNETGTRGVDKSRSPTRSKRDASPPRGPRADLKDDRRKERESSSGNGSKSRNTSMFGRLGLPIAGGGGGIGQGGEGARTSLSIRGAGRGSRQAK